MLGESLTFFAVTREEPACPGSRRRTREEANAGHQRTRLWKPFRNLYARGNDNKSAEERCDTWGTSATRFTATKARGHRFHFTWV